jgi:predicted neuraminidase
MSVETKSKRGWRVGLALACLIAWGLAMRESQSRRPLIADDKTKTSGPSAVLSGFEPLMSRISAGSPAPSVHSATAVEFPDGTIRAYWFGGSREGASDVAIWSASMRGSAWSEPVKVVERHHVSRGTRRLVRKLGNPVAHVEEDGRATLFVVSVSLGGWSGSAVNRLVLDPEGDEVVSMNRLVASPILNLGTLVRGAALGGGPGEVLLPAYHETIKKFPQLLRIGREGKVLTRGGPAVRGDLFQPWMLGSHEVGWDLFLRRGEGKETKVYHSHTRAQDWSDPVAIPVANPNAGISALRLSDGSLLLAANPDHDSRENLELLRAAEPSGPWETVFTVDTSGREEDERDLQRVEYSYPWLMTDSEGVVHLFYTWNRREIRHWRIGQDGLTGGKGGLRE